MMERLATCLRACSMPRQHIQRISHRLLGKPSLPYSAARMMAPAAAGLAQIILLVALRGSLHASIRMRPPTLRAPSVGYACVTHTAGMRVAVIILTLCGLVLNAPFRHRNRRRYPRHRHHRRCHHHRRRHRRHRMNLCPHHRWHRLRQHHHHHRRRRPHRRNHYRCHSSALP